jgi:hypothetical protein
MSECSTSDAVSGRTFFSTTFVPPGPVRTGALVHQALRAHDSQPHARRGTIAAAQDRVQIGDARPGVFDLYRQHLRRPFALDRELDFAAPGVAKRIARDFGDRGGDAHLVLPLEAEEPRDLARALARADDVLLVAQGDRHDADGHSADLPRCARRHRGIVALAPVIPKQHRGDERRVALLESRVRR